MTSDNDRAYVRPHVASPASAQRHRSDVRRHAAAYRRGIVRLHRRACRAGRAQRFRQIDLVENRRRHGRTGPRLGFRAAGRDGPLSARRNRISPASKPPSPMSRPGLVLPTTATPPAICSSSWGSTATSIRRIFPAAKRAARRSRACWRRRPISFCSTSRPTTSTSTTIEWLERDLDARRTALVIISHDRRFLSTLSRATVWLDRGETRRLERGFAHFEEWRDTVLAEEERDQHKLDRKIVAEEHWLRYGVTARRKRNMRRVGELQALRETAPHLSGERRQRRDHRQRGAEVRRAGDRGERDRQELRRPPDRRATSRSASSAATASASSGPNGSGKTTLINLLTGALSPDAARSGSARTSRSRRSTSIATVSTPTSPSLKRSPPAAATPCM